MKYKKTTLKNGLTIITVPMAGNPTATVLVMVSAGSKYETKKQNGLSHFLEHMCFKGTIKRPRPTDISRELDSMGSHYNAFTGQEFTGYYAKADAKHTDKILDVVSDIYLNSTLPAVELEKEKGVIVEEINMYEDLPQRHVQEVFMELLFGDTPVGRSIAGTKETVSSFKRNDFVSYRASHYLASATTVVVSGSINEQKVIQAVKDRFGKLPKSPPAKKLKVKDAQKTPGLKIKFKPTDQSHLILGVRALANSDPRLPTLKVLATVLGVGMSSRLFVKLREEMGVCYYARAEVDAFTDHGHLAVSAGVDKKRIKEVIEAVLNEFKRLRDDLVPQEELDKAKEYLSGTMYLNLESSDELAEFYGYQQVLGEKIKFPKDIVTKLAKVSSKDVQKLAQAIFKDNRLNLAIVGDLKNPKSISSILRL